jgi:hypothetical protein
MKNFTIILLTVIVVTNFSFAADSSQSNIQSIDETALNRGAQNYLFALHQNNAGLVESALCNIMIMKLYFPERNYEEIITKLNDLVTEGKTKQIRYKAFIACNYLKHPERFSWIKSDCFKNTIDFFNTFSEKLAKQLENTTDSLLVFSE